MLSNNIAYTKIQQCLYSCRELVEQDTTGILQCINDSIKRIEQPMQLAIIGKICTSKSTLVNSILGKKDVVATNGKELTYNVNWLIYGEENADIEINLKDGTKEIKPRVEWEKLSNRPLDGEENDSQLTEYINNIKYIRVPYSRDILKTLNIIDTPGLFSVYRTDSQNTIDFLSEINPDAVVVLFTKNISSNDITALSDFQRGKGKALFSLNPLNAIGVLAKMDVYWKSNVPDESPYSISERVISNIERDYPFLKQHLFSIMPISALLAVGATTIERHISLFRNLANVDSVLLLDKLKSVQHLMKYCNNFGITENECADLITNYGLYGIYAIVKYLIENDSANCVDLSRYLRQISGYDRFMQLIFSHFRDRASLIKVQNSVQTIIDKCENVIKECKDELIVKKTKQVQEQVLSTLMSIHEYKEWHYLFKVYNGDYTQLPADIVEEYKTICGEYGNSVVKKLNLPNDSSLSTIKQKAEERYSFWNKQYVVARRTYSRKDAELIKVMSESYNNIWHHVTEMTEKEDEAKKILNMVQTYIYG